MTLIRLHDIRENDVSESAGMSNIPWEFEYGFQRHEDVNDEQVDILDEIYNYSSETTDETVLDGLSPDANGQFFTSVRVRRGEEVMTVRYSREYLIRLANKILTESSVDLALAVQREHVLPGPHIKIEYEMCPSNGTTKCLIIDDVPHPLRQLLDLRGFPSIGKMEWVDAD